MRTVMSLFCTFILLATFAQSNAQLPDTQHLTWDGDLAAKLVDHADSFLLRELEKSITARSKRWKRDFTSPDAYVASIAANRQRFAHQLGVRDPRNTQPQAEIIVPATSAPE
ncbi:MAG: hypothetical protein KDA92_24085, partial [Planctomycetales bacterium]|nr:hypothetical protein [Planctomycetales bacterium]